MNKIHLLFILAAGLLGTSCIRDAIADCPPLAVRITVKDKNYFNVDKVDLATRVSEDLPFQDYVGSLYWTLRDFETGDVVDYHSLADVASDNEDQILPINIRTDLPHGKYILTVWGGMGGEGALGDDPTTFNLHRDNTELNDVYLTNDTIVYDPWSYDYLVELERIKGKLIVEGVNLPDFLTRSEESVDGLYSYVDNSFHYSDRVSVTKSADLDPEQGKTEDGLIVNTAVLSPSAEHDGSVLTMEFSNGDDVFTQAYTAPNVNITMNRNELTVVRYAWNPDTNQFDIYILVDDTWEKYHVMDLEED